MTQPWEIDNFLTVRNGRLHIDGHDAADLARKHGTPLFVYSEPRIRHNIARLMQAGEQLGCGFKLCYAAKAMSTLGILEVIRDAGCDLEVNSGGELFKALEAGFTGDRISFNGIAKEEWEIAMAIERGVYAIQVDSLYELSLIAKIADAQRRTANVSLRLVPEIESATHSGLQTALLTSKFGMMIEEAFEAFETYKNSKFLNFAGIHLHIGSQNPDKSVYADAFKQMFAVWLKINREHGRWLRHINLGGGFPVNYLRDRSHAPEFPREQLEMFSASYEPAEAMHEGWAAVRDYAESEDAVDKLEGITLVLEPGRSIIADAAICLTTVRNYKKRPVVQSSPPFEGGAATASDHRPLTTDHWLLTDAGFNILLSMETYKWYYHLISADRAGEPHETPYKVAGPLCDGGDVYFDIEGHGRLPDHRLLPENVEPGEVLALLNCGAYSLAQASDYNARFLPEVMLTTAEGCKIIRIRDNMQDLIRNDQR